MSSIGSLFLIIVSGLVVVFSGGCVLVSGVMLLFALTERDLGSMLGIALWIAVASGLFFVGMRGVRAGARQWRRDRSEL